MFVMKYHDTYSRYFLGKAMVVMGQLLNYQSLKKVCLNTFWNEHGYFSLHDLVTF